MSFIGNTPTQQAFTPAVDVFSGNGSTTAFTLSRPVASVAQVEAVIENVQQSPVDAYTVNGNTITFTSAPPSGSSNIYVRYTSPITQVIAPTDGSVGTSKLVDAAVTTAKLADANITPSKLSTGAPSWDANGRFYTPNQPRMSCLNAGVNGTTSGGLYLLGQASPDINVGSCFNTTTRFFTCPVAGYYRVSVSITSNANVSLYAVVMKNGATLAGNSLTYTIYNTGGQSIIVYCAASDTLAGCSSLNGSIYSAQLSIELIG
jgi:hypothetical protein